MKDRLNLSLSHFDTCVLKGIALLLLSHHLFWQQNGFFCDYTLGNSFHIVQQINSFILVLKVIGEYSVSIVNSIMLYLQS